ncbi:MAG: cellulase family glycosylhydrolase [Clostridia bacterium]|nr:cellulase family glycosylhydrolase [Clostridia bacterium]
MRKWIRRAVLLALALCCLCCCALADELTGKSALEIVSDMGIGWNLGNTFDATGGDTSDVYAQEQSWGNPIVDEGLIQRVKEAGFDTIRIPVTWYRYTSKDGSYTINPAFLARVKEVVDYARAQDLYVIINMHHEEWINSAVLDKDYVKIGEQLSAMWRQIADAFADYDQHLIFEGMNEPRMVGTRVEWTGSTDACEAVNYLNQVFVAAVRKEAKGYNGERCLMIPGYAASSSASVMNCIAIPTVNGEAVNNVIISVHCYSPYDFCLSDAQKDFDPAKSSHVSGINNTFADIKNLFLDNGIPVVIGETGATNTGNNLQAREKWAYYMGAKAAEYGVPIIIWDNGNNAASGGECHAWVRRALHPKLRSQQTPYIIPTVIEQLMKGKNSAAWGSGTQVQEEAAVSAVGGTVLWNKADGYASVKQWDNSYIQLTSKANWYGDAASVAVIYTGSGEPKIILDSAEKNQWWIPVDPDRIETIAGKKVAWFSAKKLMAEAAKFEVTDASQLRYLSIIATGANITSYEVSVVGAMSGEKLSDTITFKANGRTVHKGKDMPKEPSFTDMTFAGWYTTRDYRPGTEYTGGPLPGDATVYAKMLMTIE